jgi:hypothetical protein
LNSRLKIDPYNRSRAPRIHITLGFALVIMRARYLRTIIIMEVHTEAHTRTATVSNVWRPLLVTGREGEEPRSPRAMQPCETERESGIGRGRGGGRVCVARRESTTTERGLENRAERDATHRSVVIRPGADL